MNIVFECSEYPPGHTGGIGVMTRVVAEELARRGHNVSVVGIYEHLKCRHLVEEINGVTVFRYGYPDNASVFVRKVSKTLNRVAKRNIIHQYRLSWYERQISVHVLKFKADLLEIPDYSRFCRTSMRVKFKRFSVPTVVRCHGSLSYLLGEGHPLFASAIANDTARFERADYLSAVSYSALQHSDQYMPQLSFRDKNVIYNSINDGFVKNGSPSESKKILYIGRLEPSKGAHGVVKAFSIISSRYPEWSLHLLGANLSDEWDDVVNPDVSDRIVLHGDCTRQQVAEAIDDSAFACLPSYRETFGLAAVEVMGRKRAVIFTNRTSGPEIITHEEDGLLVDPEDIDDIARQMERLINDKQLRDYLAEKGYQKVVNNFVASLMVGQLESFYSRIAGEKLRRTL